MPVTHTELREGIDRLVGNPAITALYREWLAAERQNGLPKLAAFDPALRPAIAGNLIVVEPGEPASRYLHYGARVVDVTGTDMTGRASSEYRHGVGRFLEDTYREALASGQPLYTVHHTESQDSPVSWERLVLPVRAEDGRALLVCYTTPLDRRAELFDALLAATMDGIAVLQPALRDGAIVDFRYLIVNRRAGEMLGRDPGTLVGQPLSASLPHVEERLAAYREVMLSGVPRQFVADVSLDGRRRMFRMAAVRTGDKLVVTLSDVTELHDAMDRLESQQTELRYANETLQEQARNLVGLVETIEQARAEAQAAEHFVTKLMEAVPIPLFHWSLDGAITRSNSNYAAVYGLTPETIAGKRPEELLPPEQARLIRLKNAELLAGPEDRQVYEGDVQSGLGARHYVVHRALMRETDGRPSGITGAMLDVTDEYELRKRLELLAATDPLTGLYNRRVFMERLDSELTRYRRYDRPASAILLDIDRFKSVNDAHGHEFGDRVLIELARLLRDGVRDGVDLPARIGGEEFAVLLPDTVSDSAAILAERLRAGFAALGFATPSGTQFYTASLGVAEFGEGDDVTSLLRRADDALYRSKRQGRNRVSIAASLRKGSVRA